MAPTVPKITQMAPSVPKKSEMSPEGLNLDPFDHPFDPDPMFCLKAGGGDRSLVAKAEG